LAIALNNWEITSVSDNTYLLLLLFEGAEWRRRSLRKRVRRKIGGGFKIRVPVPILYYPIEILTVTSSHHEW